jgi:hypothetical protein
MYAYPSLSKQIASFSSQSWQCDSGYQVSMNPPLLDVFNVHTRTFRVYPAEPGWHSPERIRAKFAESLEKLGRKKVRVFYLHAPDRSVPFEDTLGEVDKMYKEGLL